MSDTKAETVAAWWRMALADRDSGAARALAARLRRAGAIEALAEPAVQELARRLWIGPAQAPRLVRLVQVLAELRNDDPAPLARRLAEAGVSHLRFQRLLRASDQDIAPQLRRALIMAERRCNARRLAGDLLAWDHPEWGDPVRARWCFDYFGGPAPASTLPPEETPA